MFRDHTRPPAVTRILLDVERPVPPLPAFTRARAMARAREAIAVAPRSAPTLLANRVSRWTLPLAIAGASIATMGIVHQLDRRAGRPAALLVIADNPGEVFALGHHTASPSRSIPEIPPAAAGGEALEYGAIPPGRQPVPSHEELALLQRARTAVAAEEWADAQSVVSAHARRFPGGQLTEEREALRVKALIGLGRTREARRAARAFEVRFPHSVLGPAVVSAGDALL